MNERETTLAALREIASKRANQVTQEDKAYIRKVSEEQGIAFEPKTTRCNSCYTDQAVILWKALQPIEDNGKRYILRAGLDVYFGSVRVNEATITDELAEWLIGSGFPKRFFEKLPE